ncbi:MAG: putative Ig domain-containing protein, partial [Rivularia sp. (in: cyanobacteria)]
MAGSDIFNNGGLGESLIDSANLGAPLDDSSSLLGVSKEIKETASGAEPVDKELERLTKKDGAQDDSNDEENSTVNRFEQPTLFNQQPYVPPVPYRSNVDGADFLTGETGDGTKVNFSAFDSLSNSGAETVAAPLKFSQSQTEDNNLVIDGGEISGVLDEADRKQADVENFIDEYSLTTSTNNNLIKLEISSDEYGIYVQVFNEDTQEIIKDSINNNFSSITFAASPDINYGVRVISYSENQLGSYTVKATSPRLVSPKDEEIISVSSSEYKYTNDYYRLQNLKVGSLVRLDIYSSEESTNIEIIDANTLEVLIKEEISYDDENNASLVFIPASDTNYLVRIYNDNYDGINYTLDVKDENLREISVNERLVDNKIIEGGFNQEDITVIYESNEHKVDFYKLNGLEVDKTITIGSKDFYDDLYTSIELINIDTGEFLGGELSGKGYGFDFQQITFTPQKDINYAIRVGGLLKGYEFDSSEEYTYSLNVKETPNISLTKSINGELDDKDLRNLVEPSRFLDNYLFNDSKEGQIVALNVSSKDFNPNLEIINLDTQEVIHFFDKESTKFIDENYNYNARIVFAPEANTNYMAWVSTTEDGKIGDYSLTTEVLENISVINTIKTGGLDTDDIFHPNQEGKFVDEYRLANLTIGNTVKLDLKPTSDDFNPYLEVYSIDKSKYSIKESEDDNKKIYQLGYDKYIDTFESFDSQAFLIPEDGVEYFVRVTSENKGETGDYTLTTSTGKPNLEIYDVNINDGEDIVYYQPFNVSWDGINRESMDAAFGWYDSIYLSKDQEFNESEDILLRSVWIPSGELPLGIGETYNLGKSVTITNDLGKNPYLIFVADSQNNLIETKEDNYFVKQIEVKYPDLKIVPVDIQSTALIGDNIEIDWKVDNIGTADINGSWTDRIWISKDEVISEDDTLLFTKEYNESTSVNSGSSYPNNNISISIPLKEALNNEVEGSDGNNRIATANDISPNFELTTVDTYVAEINGNTNNENNFDQDYFKFYASPGDKIVVDILPREESDISNIYLNLRTKQNWWSASNEPWNEISQLSYTFTDSDYKGEYYIQVFDNFSNNVKYTLKTTLETPNLITSQLRDGSYNLIFETDTEDKFKESDESNNFITRPIFLTSSQLIPDLEISVKPFNKTAVIGEEIEVTWTVTNTSENAQALADWSDSIYISTNDNIKESDIPVVVKSAAEKTPLQPGESYTFTEKVTLPNSIGNYNILVVTDTNNNQIETDEDNNVVKIPIEVIAPDLKVESLNGVSTAEFGETIELSWEIENTGKADAAAGNERIWLSTDEDAKYNPNKDFLLQPVNAVDSNYSSITGNSILPRSASVTLSSGIEWKESEYYIFVETDINDTTFESNEGNNISTSKAIYLSLPPIPDLTVDDVQVSETGKPSEEIKISWNVYNSDTETTVNGSWIDKIYLIAEKNYSSVDGYSLNDAIPLDTVSYTATIASLDKHGIINHKVNLPSDIADGDYRVIIVTDERDDIYEGTFENNNQGVSTGKLTIGRVDLTPKIIEVDTNPTSGDKITLRYEVTNNGSSATSGTWVDKIYLSTDSPENFSYSDRDLIKTIQHDTGLTDKQSYSKDAEIDLPLDISGERYLYVVTDATNNIGELNATNDAEENTVHQKLQIELAEYADLAVSDITVTEDTIGNPATINVGWKVTNIGTGAGKTDQWVDRIIASTDDKIGNSDDIVIATFNHTGFLDADSSNPDTSYYFRSEDIQLPSGFEGKYNLYVETGFSSIFENGLKDNNFDVAEKPFFVAKSEYSDLIVTDVRTEVTTAETGETIKLQWTVKNDGRTVTNTNSWSDSVVLYDSQGNSVFSQRYDRIGTLSNEDGKNTYTRTVDLELPLGLKADSYYFEVTTGDNSSLYESIYDDNNSNNNKDKQIAITPSPSPDLKVGEIKAVTTATAGEKIDVTWEIENQSTNADAIGSWVDYIYLEEVGVTNPTTRYLGSFAYQGTLEAGKNYKRTEEFKLNQRIEGSYKIVVKTNTTKSLFEPIDNNNTNNSQKELLINLPERPDLQIELDTIKVPDILAAGNTIPKNSIEFTVVNRGTVAATGTWTDNVYLSLDGEISSDDILIGSFVNGAALEPLNTNNSNNIPNKKDSYLTVVTESFDIPKYLRGEAYIIVQADANNQIDEYPKDESNKLAQKVQIESLKPSDLVTSNVKVISEAFEGSEIKVSYKVTNQGVEETDRDRWTDSVWLTTEPNRRPQAELGDILLDNFTRNGGLQTSNDSIDVINYYENEVTVNIPNQVSGNYYITVWSDSNEEVTEDTFSNNSNLDNSDTTNNPQNEIDFNNFSSRPILVKLQPSPDLTVSNIKIDEIPNPKAGELFKVTWKVDNITDIATEEDYWYDEVYISDKSALDDKDAKKWYIGRYQRSGKLNAREGYTGELETVLSPGVQGQYIIVKTNAGEQVWESVYTNNNEKNLQQDIATTQSDLEVIGIEVKPIEADNNNYSGDATKIEWTVRNNGAPVWEGTRYWYDEIWISDNPVFNKDQSTKIGFVPYSPTEQFGKGDIYTNSTEVVLPPGYDGEYYIHVSTNLSHDKNTSRFSGSLPEYGDNDSKRKSFEYRVHEDTSNNLNQTSITVTYREADLLFLNESIKVLETDDIPGIQSGETIEVTWDVTNNGTRDTRENIWYDRVYLSQDGSLDRSDVYLGKYRRKGSLQINGSYQGKATITLPEGIDGDYQLLVFTDSNLVETPIVPNIGFEAVDRRLARVPEFDNEDNNIASIPLSVTLRPSADLQVTDVKINADNSKAIAGQSFTIDYTVTNVDDKGDTPETQQEWTDLIYLSRDKYLDLNKDIFLNYVDHKGGLKAGESYTVTNKTLQIPLNLAGLYNNEAFDSASYYVFVVTDPTKTNVRGKVYEGENENNNDKHSDQALIIERPPEVDLVVQNDSITVKNQGNIVTSGNVGDEVEISWRVNNNSENTTSVNWSDAVYLSKDNEWDINDTLLGYYKYNKGLLAENSDYEAKITTFLPALTPTDDYRIIIRNDVYNQVWEGFGIGEKNNVVLSTNQLEINAESLQLNVLEENISLGKEQERLYEIDVEAFSTLRITLNGEEAARNEIFVRYNEAPSGVEYDAASTGIIGDKQTATVSNTKAGKYYVLVRTVNGNSGNVNLIAEELPFGVTNVVTDRGGDSRYVTTNIYGAQFNDKAVVKLVRPGIAEYIPVNYKVVNNTHIQAIFDLTNAPHGLYDVKVINADGEEAVLPYRYLVERAIEQDVRIGLGGPRIIAPGEVGTYGVSLQSLTNVDTPYVHFQFGIPELGENEKLSLLSDFLVPDSQRKDLKGLPYVQFTSNLRGEPDAKLSDDVPWASLISDVNTDGRILAPGYVVDLPNAGYVGSTFNVHTYPGLKELLEINPDLLESISDEEIAFKFNILATATVMNRDEFIAEQTSEALKLRTAILNDNEASTALVNLASNQETWTNSYLAALESAGLLRSEDGIPPIRENTKVISLMATLASGLLLGSAGDTILTDGGLVSFFSKVREWYGHKPDRETDARIPDLSDFDKKLTQVTHTSAFNVYVPFKKARVDLPPTVEVPRPSFDKFFNTDSVNNELASITGPIGYGEDNFIPLDAQLPYTINFETSSTSTSAVGEIRIVTKLDQDLDPRTFQLGGLRLGDIEVNVPTGRAFLQEEFDFSKSKGFNLRISAGLEPETNTVSWLIQAIDVKTGEIIQNPDIGLLLPNTEENIGSGFVSYTVLPSADIATGAAINSSARVFYNNAAPIDTAEAINIADGEAPGTTINVKPLGEEVNSDNSNYDSLQQVEGSENYLVSWKPLDDEAGSGIKHVTVYVAENGGDFKIWQRQTTDTEAVFSGNENSTYEFLALATDNAGNTEQPLLGINAPSDGSTVNLGTIPTVTETSQPEIIRTPKIDIPSTNELFIEARKAEIPTNLSDNNKPEFDKVLRPFTAQSFATNIQQSHGEIGAMAIAVMDNGDVIASGGSNRGSLYRFDKEGGGSSNPFAILKYPVFDLALDKDGFLWGVTGGASLIKLDPQTGEIINEYGDSITTGLAINSSDNLIYVASGNGIEVFNSETEEFEHYSDIRVDNLAINPRDGKLWATTYPKRGNVISFDEDGKATLMVEYDSPIDSIAFGEIGTQLEDIIFVSDNSGKLHMVDTASLESITIAEGGSRGEIVETTPDGKVLVAQSNQIDIFNPVLSPDVKAINPAPGSTVALPQGKISITFDTDMFEGDIHEQNSVFNPNNYQLIDIAGNIVNPLSVRYDKINRTALLEFNGIDAGEYEISILPSLESSAGLKMESGYNAQFTAISNFSDKVEFKFDNPRSNRQNQTVSYDVTITNTSAIDLQLPLMLVLDPAQYFNGEVIGVIGQNRDGAFLVDLQDSLDNGTLKAGESITNRTITVFNPDAYRVELAPGIYTLPYPNAAPTITSNPVVEAIANTEYNYQILAKDSDGVEFGYLLDNAPEGMSVSENGLITWNPTEESVVNSKVELYVFDKRGGYSKQEFTINVTGGNNKPVFNNISAITGASVTTQNNSFQVNAFEAQTLQLQIAATDVDSDKLTYWADNLPPGAVFDAKTGILTWTPGNSSAGTYEDVTFVVTDGNERITQTATFLVEATNQLPTFKTIPSKIVREGESVRIQLFASDAEGDNLTYSSKLLPGGSKLDPLTGLFEWKPGFFQAGEFEIPFIVSDGESIVTQNAKITVLNANAAPVFEDIGKWYVQEGEQLRFRAFAYDADNPDFVPQERNADGDLTILEGSLPTVNYTVGNLPDGATFDKDTAIFSWKPDFDKAGNYNVTFTATDDGDGTDFNASTSITIPITVYNTNRAPEIAEFDNISLNKGETQQITIEVTDAEGDNLSLNLVREREAGFGIPDFVDFVDNGDGKATLNISPTDKDISGSYTFTLIAEEINRTDSETALYTEKTFNINVLGNNDAPQIEYIGDKVAVVGETLKFDVLVKDNNQDDLNFEIVNQQELPSGITLTQKGRYGKASFEWKLLATDEGILDKTYPVTIRVTDSGNGNGDEIFSSEQTFNINVRNSNTAPQLNPIPNLSPEGILTIKEAETFELQLLATDSDNDTITYLAKNLPQNASLDAKTGLLTWKPDYSQAGIYENITIIATDGNKRSEKTFSIEVENTNRAPVIVPLPTQIARENEYLRFSLNAVDYDVEGVVFSPITNLPEGATFDTRTGEFVWKPTYNQSGQYKLTFEVSDAGGAIGKRDVDILITDTNRNPELKVSNRGVALGETLNFNLEGFDPDEKAQLTYSADILPEGATLNTETGTFIWTPNPGQVDDYSINFSVSDGISTVTENVLVKVALTAENPTVNLDLTPGFAVTPNQSVIVTAFADGFAEIDNITVKVDGETKILDRFGRFEFIPTTAGKVFVEAIATDEDGRVGRNFTVIKVRNPLDNNAPIVELDSAVNASRISEITDIVGEVSDVNLDSWKLEIASFGEGDYKAIAQGENTVNENILAQIDPNKLNNGFYQLRLTATDISGRTSTTETVVEINSTAKTSAYTRKETDLTYNFSSLPLNITRTYNSLDNTWRFSTDTDIQTNVPLTGREELGVYEPYRVGTRLYLNTPTGERVGFTFAPQKQEISGLTYYSPEWVADAGVEFTLNSVDANLTLAGNRFYELNTGFAYNPASGDFSGAEFTLTAADGTQYLIDSKKGITEQIADGISLVYSDSGITSSTGEMVQFVNDEQGFLKEIIAPDGTKVVYDYLDGNLVAARNLSTGDVRRYGYNDSLLTLVTGNPGSNGKAIAYNEVPQITDIQRDLGGVVQWNGYTVNGNSTGGIEQYTFGLRSGEIESTATGIVLVSAEVTGGGLPSIAGLTPVATDGSYALFAIDNPGLNLISLTPSLSHSLTLKIAGDLDGNGAVDGADSAELATAIANNSNEIRYDFNRDGVVNAADMQILGSNYGFAANIAPIVTPTTVLTHTGLEAFIDLDKLATDPEGDPIYFRLADSSNGIVSFTPDGKSVIFTPGDGYSGDEASFDLIADDGFSTAATVTIRVNVSDAPLINLDIVNRSPRLDAGESTELVVIGDFADQEDVILPASYLQFGSESGLVADINQYGVLSGISDGVEIVSVRKNGISAVTAVRVGDIPAPSNDSEFYVALAEQDGLQLYPEAVTLTTGMTRQLLVGLDESFSPLLTTADATSYYVSNSKVLEIDENGLITTKDEGVANVTIFHGAAEEVVPIRVLTPPEVGARVLGEEGGIVQGSDGSLVMIPPDTLAEGTTVSYTKLEQSDVGLPIPTSEDLPFVGAFNLDFGDTALDEAVQLAIPNTTGLEVGTEVVFMREGFIPNENGGWDEGWLIEEVGIVGSDNMIRTQSPPFPGVKRSGNYVMAASLKYSFTKTSFEWDLSDPLALPEGYLAGAITRKLVLRFILATGVKSLIGVTGLYIGAAAGIIMAAAAALEQMFKEKTTTIDIFQVPPIGLPQKTELGVQLNSSGVPVVK